MTPPPARACTRTTWPRRRGKGRRWGAYNVFTLWANDVHSLGNYAFAIGLFALGLNVWGILAAFALASVLLFLLLTLSGFMGHKTGVPFPVMSRIAFGIKGAKLPAAVRGAVAIAWFGIQTYLASAVLSTLLVAMFPGLARLDTNSLLGQSTLGWITFLVLWALQVVIVSYGMQMIRRYMAFAAPHHAAHHVRPRGVDVRSGRTARSVCPTASRSPAARCGSRSCRPPPCGSVIYGTFVLNFCDFTWSARAAAPSSAGT
ncbi:cytosine permease [Streptomyces thinghirensis]|nr:cytosine permease [Streptomyces thinghirensis]